MYLILEFKVARRKIAVQILLHVRRIRSKTLQ
jgi:hypothetical protein